LNIGAITGIYSACVIAFILLIGGIVAGAVYGIVKMVLKENRMAWMNVLKEI